MCGQSTTQPVSDDDHPPMQQCFADEFQPRPRPTKTRSGATPSWFTGINELQANRRYSKQRDDYRLFHIARHAVVMRGMRVVQYITSRWHTQSGRPFFFSLFGFLLAPNFWRS
jgi:hypothetical protein